MFLVIKVLQERQYGSLVELDELFMAIHTNKKSEWVDTRSGETYVTLFLQFFPYYL